VSVILRVLNCGKKISDIMNHNSAIMTEFVVNESFSSLLPPTKYRLSSANRITRIALEIVLAM
jgi:hypothetical protein